MGPPAPTYNKPISHTHPIHILCHYHSIITQYHNTLPCSTGRQFYYQSYICLVTFILHIVGVDENLGIDIFETQTLQELRMLSHVVLGNVELFSSVSNEMSVSMFVLSLFYCFLFSICVFLVSQVISPHHKSLGDDRWHNCN